MVRHHPFDCLELDAPGRHGLGVFVGCVGLLPRKQRENRGIDSTALHLGQIDLGAAVLCTVPGEVGVIGREIEVTIYHDGGGVHGTCIRLGTAGIRDWPQGQREHQSREARAGHAYFAGAGVSLIA